MRLRVLFRAAWAKLMRLGGRAYPPPETHPDDVRMQPSDASAARARGAPLRLAQAKHREMDPQAWQKDARDKLTELLALERDDVSWQSSWQRDIEGLATRRIYLHRREGLDIPITIVEDPSREKAGPPLVIMLGTFSAVHLALGEARLPYDVIRLQNGADIGLQAARQGYTAICVELASLGERRERRYAGGSGTGTAAEAALLFGHCLLGDRVSDLMAVVDWWSAFCAQEQRSHAHPWVLGHSAGGTVALFGAAADVRIQGCVASGCVGYMRDTLLTRRNDGGQNTVPGILNWLELDDVAALIAPRPLLAVSAHADHIWPYAGCKAVVDGASLVWEQMDAGALVRTSAADGEHHFHPDATWPALSQLMNLARRAEHA